MQPRYLRRPIPSGTVALPIVALYRAYPAMAPVSIIEGLATRLDGGAPTAAPSLSATITTDNTGVAHVAATSTNYETGLLPSTAYFYVWTAFSATGVESLVSVERSITTGAGVTPAITTSLTGAVTGAVKYRIYRGAASGQQKAYYETTSTTYKDTGALSPAFNVVYAGYAPPTVTNAATITTVSGAVPLTQSQLFTADLVARKVAVWVDTGSGLVECPVYCRGLGRYADGSYRSVYFKVNVGVAVPTYPPAIYQTAAVYGTRRAVPTYPTAGFRAQVRFGTVRTTTDLTTSDLDATWGFTDPTTHLPPQLWLERVEVRGFTPGVLAATDPTYLTKCGAFDNYLTRDESENAATAGASVAALHLHYNTRFDTILRDLWFNGREYFEGTPAWGNSYDVSTVRCQAWEATSNMILRSFSGTGATYPASPIRNSQNATPEPTWAGEVPPMYGHLREMAGSGRGSSFEQQYYDPGLIFFQQYLRTGDLAYYQRACTYLWAYSWWGRWVTPANNSSVPDGRVIPFVYSANFAHQPEGIAYHTLLTADPASQYHNQVFANNWWGDSLIADDFTSGGGGTVQPQWPDVVSTYGLPSIYTIGAEPRPVVRVTHATSWAHLLSRPAGDAGIAAGVTLFPQTRDWAGQLLTSLTKIFDTGSSWLQPSITSGGAVAWCQQNATPGTNFINTFMQPMVCDLGQKVLQRHPELAVALQNKIIARIKANADFLFATMLEYDVNDNSTNPGTDAAYRIAGFKNWFLGHPAAEQEDVHRYEWGGVDVTNMYTPTFAWLTWQFQDGTYSTITDRLFDLGIGVDDSYQGERSPFVADGQVKQTRECYCFGHKIALARSLGPAPVSLPLDTLFEVRVVDPVVPTFPGATSTFAHGASRTLIGKRRTARRRLIQGGTPLVASVTAGGPNLSITSQTWDAYSRLIIVITAAAAGTGTITVTDPDNSMTGTCAVTIT